MRVTFVSFTGKFPNLCAGILVLDVDGVKHAFNGLSSGGGCSRRRRGEDFVITKGEWSVHVWPEEFPKELREEALEVINKNVRFGCCGGCS